MKEGYFIARIIACRLLQHHRMSSLAIQFFGEQKEKPLYTVDGHVRLLKKEKTVKGDVTEAEQPTPQVEDAQIEAEQPICDEDECLEISGNCTLMEGEEWRKGWRCRTTTTTGACDTIYHCFDNPCNNAVCADGEKCKPDYCGGCNFVCS